LAPFNFEQNLAVASTEFDDYTRAQLDAVAI
jgi:hypothetical protein